MCKWIGRHWWREAKGWGVRKCRFCGRSERAIYSSAIGRHWVLFD